MINPRKWFESNFQGRSKTIQRKDDNYYYFCHYHESSGLSSFQVYPHGESTTVPVFKMDLELPGTLSDSVLQMLYNVLDSDIEDSSWAYEPNIHPKFLSFHSNDIGLELNLNMSYDFFTVMLQAAKNLRDLYEYLEKEEE